MAVKEFLQLSKALKAISQEMKGRYAVYLLGKNYSEGAYLNIRVDGKQLILPL